MIISHVNQVKKKTITSHLQLIIQVLYFHPVGLGELDFLEVAQQLTVLFVALLCDLILVFEKLITEHCINNLI